MKPARTLLLLLSILMLPQTVSHSAELKNLDKDYWLEVYLSGQRIGTRHRTVTRTSLDGKPVYKYEETESIRFISNGDEIVINNTNTVCVDSMFWPVRMNTKTTISSGSTEKHEYACEATRSQKSIDVKRTEDGKTSTATIPIPDGVDLSTYYAYLLGGKKLSVGEKLSGTFVCAASRALDPWECACVGTNTLRIGSKSYGCLRTVQKLGADTTLSYILEDCTTIRQKILNFSNETDFYVTPSEAAQWILRYTPDITGQPATIDADRPLDTPEPPTTLRIRLTSVPDERSALSDDRQIATCHKDGNYVEYRVTAKRFSGSKSLSLPIKDAEWLEPSEGIQSDDKDIQALSRTIVGNETNAYKALRKLQAWVHENIKPKYASGTPLSATDILKAKLGDCKHCAIILTALARAAGIPTRLADGIHSTGGMFFFCHEWVECYVGAWVPLDPTTDEDHLNATYIKLHHGNLSDMADQSNAAWLYWSTVEVIECK